MVIYLDYNATTPVDPLVGRMMMPYFTEYFGNPSSSHAWAVKPKIVVESSRAQIAHLLNCSREEIIFTSGGSESNNMAIKGAALSYKNKGNHILTSSIEHPAVIEVCKYLERTGFSVTYLPVDEFGVVDPNDVEEAITAETILISIMHANNEVGTIQSISEIAEIAHRKSVVFHSDCAQSVGKIPVDVTQLGVDMLSIAGHKIYAPKGIGALYVKTGTKLEKLIHGADHELNMRAGTENVPLIVGLGKACELISTNRDSYFSHMYEMRNYLEENLKSIFSLIKINGHPENRLPNTLSVSFKSLEANTILSELTEVAVSAGAACHSDSIDISPVLEAMKVPREYAMGTIRFSVGRPTIKSDIDSAVQQLEEVINKLQPEKERPTSISAGTKIKLTHFTHGLGCACKLRPQLLEEVLKKMPLPSDEKILVGANNSDDAAVYKIDEETAIVQTVDFFTPIVDDPFEFGQIAAANSLSDIYAMGAKPLFALNIVGFPSNRLPIEVLQKILEGAEEKAQEAGISIIGGHTVDDTEPKFGLAVTGIVHPKKVIKNSGAKTDDCLVLTKPLGTGILSTAMKSGTLNPEGIKQLVETMSALNKNAADAMIEIGANACTDVTGFGLLGHLIEMMKASGKSAVINFENIKFLKYVYDSAVAGIIPGGTKDNFSFTENNVEYAPSISEIKRLMLNDAQTSGGLLISVDKKQCSKLIERLQMLNVTDVVCIGSVGDRGDKIVTIQL